MNILKHMVWRFRIYNYFREIFKFRDLLNTLRNFAKYVFVHILSDIYHITRLTFIFNHLAINPPPPPDGQATSANISGRGGGGGGLVVTLSFENLISCLFDLFCLLLPYHSSTRRQIKNLSLFVQCTGQGY